MKEGTVGDNGSRWWLKGDSAQILVDASAEVIYRLIADMPRMGEWSPECQRVEWTAGTTAPEVGATFVGHNRGGPRQLMRWSRAGRVLAAECGKEFAFVTEEGGRESTVWTYTLEPTDGKTRVSEAYEVRWIPAWARILDIPTNRHRELSEAMRVTLSRLKTAAEAEASGSTLPTPQSSRSSTKENSP
jgi:Polyketide cyclase / dehydrase and lipid transport